MDDRGPGHPDPEIRRGPGLKKKKIGRGGGHGGSVSSKSKEEGGGGEAGYPGPVPWIRHCVVVKSRKFRHHKHVCSVWHDLSICVINAINSIDKYSSREVECEIYVY